MSNNKNSNHSHSINQCDNSVNSNAPENRESSTTRRTIRNSYLDGLTSTVSIATPVSASSSLLFVNAVDTTTRVSSLLRTRKPLRDVLDEVFDILQQHDENDWIDRDDISSSQSSSSSNGRQ